MQQKVRRYKERVYEVESELEDRAVTIATYKGKVLLFMKILCSSNMKLMYFFVRIYLSILSSHCRCYS